jgi:hypothetical protein
MFPPEALSAGAIASAEGLDGSSNGLPRSARGYLSFRLTHQEYRHVGLAQHGLGD